MVFSLIIQQMRLQIRNIFTLEKLSLAGNERVLVWQLRTHSFPKHLFHRSLVKFLRLQKYYCQLDKRSGIELNISSWGKKGSTKKKWEIKLSFFVGAAQVLICFNLFADTVIFSHPKVKLSDRRVYSLFDYSFE